MIAAIHQPNYLPYLGFFDKMIRADVFVIYDDAQFNKGDFQHRNKIRIFNGWKWLTIPVEKKCLPIREIKIKNEVKNKNLTWNKSHISNIYDNYKEAPYYLSYNNDIETIYTKKHEKLININMDLINFLMSAFEIETKIVFSSELNLFSQSTQRLVEIVESVGCDTYLSGAMGHNYLDDSLFRKKNIDVKFQDFEHPTYKQCYKGFCPNMSALDILFCTGGHMLE